MVAENAESIVGIIAGIGPVAAVAILLSAGFIGLLYVIVNKFLETVKEYPAQLKEIGEGFHENTRTAQDKYQEQINNLVGDQKLMVREVITSIVDNTKTLSDLKQELRSNRQ